MVNHFLIQTSGSEFKAWNNSLFYMNNSINSMKLLLTYIFIHVECLDILKAQCISFVKFYQLFVRPQWCASWWEKNENTCTCIINVNMVIMNNQTEIKSRTHNYIVSTLYQQQYTIFFAENLFLFKLVNVCMYTKW